MSSPESVIPNRESEENQWLSDGNVCGPDCRVRGGSVVETEWDRMSTESVVT